MFTKPHKIRLFSAILATAGIHHAAAEVTLAGAFSDHMVLQRGMTVPIWGKATGGEAVSVTLRGQTKSVITGSDGNWKVALDPGMAGGPFELSVQGKNALVPLVIKDVMVGEVWLAGGQSNMAFSMKSIGGPNLDSVNAADYPDLRLMNVQGGSKWKACTPASVLDFSATAYYFGRDLHQSLKVPVGIILSAVGGTEIEEWMDPATLAADPLLKTDTSAGHLYQKWIAPIATFGMHGAVWYQGEFNARYSDTTHPTWVLSNYHARFEAHIKGWRKAWNQGDFPFYFVQLPNINGLQTNAGGESPWAELREAQRLTLSVANTAMVVTIDIGEANNLHPFNKWDVGRRLTLAARAREYGEKTLPYSGPMYQSMKIDGRNLRLVFHDAEGMTARSPTGSPGAKATGVAIAGADNKWNWADVVFSKDTLIVSSALVAAPTKVRYGWGQNPPCNLFNAAGLPASPFQTDGSQLPVVGLARGVHGASSRPSPSLAATGPSGFDLSGRKRIRNHRMAKRIP